MTKADGTVIRTVVELDAAGRLQRSESTGPEERRFERTTRMTPTDG
ncbi:MAG: hypothetical protein IPP68_12070 [Elusimicrobia bacterium]|nr:hypothetical protein [Elusimicrobiota bacterium]